MKKFLFSSLFILLAFGIIASVRAVSFTLYVSSNGGSGSSDTMSYSGNRTWGTLYIEYVSGGNNYDMYLQSYYNGSWVNISSKKTVSASLKNYTAEFSPTGIGYCRNFNYTITCSGSNTTSSKCVLANNSYRYRVYNGSILGGTMSITGSLLAEN